MGRWASVRVDLDADDLDAELPTAGLDRLDVLLLASGTPLARRLLTCPVDLLAVSLVLAQVGPEAAARHHRSRLLPPPALPQPDDVLPASVVLCTRDRGAQLADCLASLACLRPAPAEVVVVDNGTAGQTVEDVVRSHGFRYVRQPIRGASRSRNAGVAAARHDLVLFTDDDVQVDPTWAAELVAGFADPLVAAVTGLVLPQDLSTPVSQMFEVHAGFSRGLDERRLDGSVINPFRAGVAGASASMAVRRSEYLTVGGMAEHLGPGTPSGAGEDTLLVHQLLLAGYRVQYRPRALSTHRHRDTMAAFDKQMHAYGTAMVAYALTAIGLERRPGSAIQGGRATAAYLLRHARDAALNRPGALPRRVAAAELGGALRAPTRLRAARREATTLPSTPLPVPMQDGLRPWLSRLLDARPAPATVTGELPRLSVVVPTRGRREHAVHLVRRLQDQQYDAARLEVIVALDGDVDGTGAALAALDVPVRPELVRLVSSSLDPHHGQGAGAARNAGAAAASGDVLLFLDDDVRPVDRVLLQGHASGQARRPGALVGMVPPATEEEDRYLTQGARAWWCDQTRALLREEPLRFTDVTTANLSVLRTAFLDAGGFMPLPRREDWELGQRLASRGVELRALPAAAVLHQFETDVSGYLADVRREGAGDSLMAERHPAVVGMLPLGGWRGTGPRRRRALQSLVERAPSPRLLPAVAPAALRALESAGLRSRWQRALGAVVAVAYWSGVGDALAGSVPRLEALLARADALAAEGCGFFDAVTGELMLPTATQASEIDVHLGGRPLYRVPLRWGGIPFDVTRFTETVLARWEPQVLAAAALTDVRVRPVSRRL